MDSKKKRGVRDLVQFRGHKSFPTTIFKCLKILFFIEKNTFKHCQNLTACPMCTSNILNNGTNTV